MMNWKIILTLILVALIKVSAAQFRYNGGIDIAIPQTQGFSIGYGVVVGGEYLVSEHTAATIQLKGSFFNQDDYFQTRISMIPIQLGYKYYLSSDQTGLFAHGQIGVHIFGFNDGVEKTSETYMNTSLGIGFAINESITISGHYTFLFGEEIPFNYLGFTGTYSF